MIVNPEVLSKLYGHVPELTDVRVRSLTLNWRGPTVTLRVDLPFPDDAPQEWREAGSDTVQGHFHFLAVSGIDCSPWKAPAVADVAMGRFGDEGRMRVSVVGPGLRLNFECSESVRVNHVSAFRIGADGADGADGVDGVDGADAGARQFVSKLDARRYSSLPATEEYSYYER